MKNLVHDRTVVWAVKIYLFWKSLNSSQWLLKKVEKLCKPSSL